MTLPAVSAAEKRRGERKEAKRCLSEASSFCPARTEHRREPAERAAMFAQPFWVLLGPQKYLATACEAGVRNAFNSGRRTGKDAGPRLEAEATDSEKMAIQMGPGAAPRKKPTSPACPAAHPNPAPAGTARRHRHRP